MDICTQQVSKKTKKTKRSFTCSETENRETFWKNVK